MTEVSRFWDGTTTGDATASPYDAASEFADVLRTIANDLLNPNAGKVYGAGGALAVSAAASTATIQDGYAMVWGTWYHNDASLGIAIPTPISATRVDRIVLRKDWVAQTVRLTLVQGVEGGSEPALTQVTGTTWDIPLAKLSTTTGAVTTVTDERQLLPVGASYFVPWTGIGPFARTTIANPNDNAAHTYTLTGVPVAATAVLLMYSYGSGAAAYLEFGTTAAGTDRVFELTTPATGDRSQFTIPLSTPQQIECLSAGAGGPFNFSLDVIGWYMPVV